MKNKLSSRLVLVAISALFVLPLLLAWLLFNGTISMNTVETRSFGELVQPPVAVDWENNLVSYRRGNEFPHRESMELFNGHWVILHVVPPHCPAACLAAVLGLRQVHIAAGRNQQRILIALLIPGTSPANLAAELKEMYPQFQLFQYPGEAIQRVLNATAGEFSADSAGSSYLIDPIGNIMMFYPAGFDPNDLNKDLKRLMTWSKLDK